MKKLEIIILVPLAFLAMLLWLVAPRGSTVLLVLFLIGAFVFYWGFRTFREFRILEDTPLVRVRSMPMGLVHVKGKATGEDPLTSPLTKQPCFYYCSKLDKWERTGKSKGWAQQPPKIEWRKFYLDDGAGKVLVDPKGAEFDVLRTFYAEIGPHSNHSRFADPSLGTPGPSEEELRAYLQARLVAAEAVYKAQGIPAFMAKGLEKSQAAAQKDAREGSYRITEQCLLADRECTILGTCAENPAPKDEHDRNLVRQGQNEKTFLITTKTEREEEKRLRHRALALVLAGAGIMTFTAAVAIFPGKTQPSPVNVHVHIVTGAPPKPSPPPPEPVGGRVDNLAITQVEPQPDYKGPCPAKFTLHFFISTTGPAEVKYNIVNQADRVWESGRLHFDGEGIQTVSWPFKMGIPGQLWQGSAKVDVYSPNHLESEEARLSVDCRP